MRLANDASTPCGRRKTIRRRTDDTIAVFVPVTGVEHCARNFVAALGASNYTYAEARWTKILAVWVGAHVNALAVIGGPAEGASVRQTEGERETTIAL
jgi:hypothetical protein